MFFCISSMGERYNNGLFFQLGLLVLVIAPLFGCGEGSEGKAKQADKPQPVEIPAELKNTPDSERLEELVQIGQVAFAEKGCVACHTTTDQALSGPVLRGIDGEPVKLEDGRVVVRDNAYFYKNLLHPDDYVIDTGPVKMPTYAYLDEETLVGLVYFVRSLSGPLQDSALTP